MTSLVTEIFAINNTHFEKEESIVPNKFPIFKPRVSLQASQQTSEAASQQTSEAASQSAGQSVG